MTDFNKKLIECEGCAQQWLKPESLDSWYEKFKGYSQRTTGGATACAGSWDSANEIVVPSAFSACLTEFLGGAGRQYASDILFNEDKTNLVGYRIKASSIFIDSAAREGKDMLLDIQSLNKQGIDKTFAYSPNFYDYESYVVFQRETVMNVVLALVAVFCIVLIFTASLTITLLVLLCVLLVDVFLFGLLAFWSIKLNSVTVVQIVIAVGLAVDYSAHIAHAFQIVQAPETHPDGKPLTNSEKRAYKAKGALGAMGTSVFHGAASTFLAIVVLSPSSSYVFETFF